MRIYIPIFLFLLIGFVAGQDEYQEDFQKIKSRYNYDVFRPSVVDFNYFIDYKAGTGDQIFVFAVSIQNDFLQFNKQSDKFISQYEISMIIRQDEETWFSKSWQKEAEISDFEMTNSKRYYQYQTFQMNLKEAGGRNLQIGDYEILLEIHDKLSSRVYKNKRKLNFKGWMQNQKVRYTEITFLRDNIIDSSTACHITATRNIIDINTPYYALACLFIPANQNIEANIRLYKKENDEKDLFKKDYLDIQSDSSGKALINYPLPYKKMEEGKYSLRFSFSLGDSTYEIEKDFSIMWFLKPLYLFKIDLAVRPLKYLLSPGEMEKVKSLEMPELTRWFKAFWKERDPDTSTVFNELEDVFYKRVTETVRSFSTRFQEGWQTDRGMVYLLYGEPSEIENRTYSVNSLPHIIWKYNYDDSVRQFIFVDKTKNGEYVLVDNENEQD